VVYWDKATGKFSGKGTSSSTYNSLKSSSNSSNGTVVFNSYDSKFTSSTPTQYVSVYVTPIGSSGEIECAVEYHHSCYTTSFTGAALNPAVDYGGKGAVSGSVGVSINWASTETVWGIGDENAIYY